MTLLQLLESRLSLAIETVLGEKTAVAVTPAADLRFGDYQSNVAMVNAKKHGKNPRALAQEIIDAIDLVGIASAEIAGPGFLNFRVFPEAYAVLANELLGDERLGLPQIGGGKTVVIDFSAPNVAKPMHVGHIRSTIIGDTLCRVARALGFEVIADNHIGDWGTQFGMILYGWKNLLDEKALAADPITELVRLYRDVNNAGKENPETRELCKAELVKLQAGDEENLAIWNRCIDLSKEGLQKIYGRLDVSFDHWLGESYYNDRLAGLVDELLGNGIARVSEGAVCVFSDETKKPENDPFKIKNETGWADFPMIVRKSDGGFNYATTDLATLEFRKSEWKADSVWYVVDHRQSLHFQQLFDVAGRIGLDGMDLRHISFGTILGKDGKPLKTRSGDLPQLADLLDEAVAASAITVAERSRVDTDEERKALAELIGISAVKFTELAHHRSSDYVFDLEKMLALQGDTAPYLQNAYVRSRSIWRKLGDEAPKELAPVSLSEEAEIHLARLLVRFGEVVPTVLDDFRPNLLANYLLEVARAFHSFFEACPVLKADSVEIRDSRLSLCELTSRTLKQGLGLLGIAVPERM
ncbi:MAG TPA: arginine--tRNA ligase [Luteolibacter sp.]|nr:arginine--tRNA ligase [Luteolibacter sp.]